MHRLLLIILLFISTIPLLTAQNRDKLDAIEYKGIQFHLSYGGDLPLADMKDRFGANLHLGGSIEFMSGETLWGYGITGRYIFGQDVKVNPLKELITHSGDFVGVGGILANVALRERGLYAGVYVAKYFPLSDNLSLNAIKIRAGGGYMHHRIRIKDDTNSLPLLEEDYLPGYEMKEGGAAVDLGISYQHLDHEGLLNFRVGVHLLTAFTSPLRAYDHNIMSEPKTNRMDVLLGGQITWIIPLYFGQPPSDIYY